MERNNEITFRKKINQKSHFVASLFRYFVRGKGFSLVELLVVVGIIAILSVTSIAGFGYLKDTLKTRAVTGLLGDMIKQEELKILRGDFNKSTIYFLADYVVIDEEPADKTLKLSFRQTDSCILFDMNDSTPAANLIKKNEEGVNMETKSVAKGSSECVSFKDSEDLEWNYQLNESEQFSNTVRFIHFNIQRDDLNNPVSITEGAGSKIEVMAPYGKKLIYKNDGTLINNPTDKVNITVKDKNENSSDTITLQ
jgi:prepilin-type N-terminal cleavage/methylation domain-containing protein